MEGKKGLSKYQVDATSGRLSEAGEVALPFIPADMVISRKFQ
jgi:hypothetical protein